jgi:hypothetical protein
MSQDIPTHVTLFTVAHYSPFTLRWHIETDDDGEVWTTHEAEARALAAGYRVHGFPKATVMVLADLLDFSDNIEEYGSMGNGQPGNKVADPVLAKVLYSLVD